MDTKKLTTQDDENTIIDIDMDIVAEKWMRKMYLYFFSEIIFFEIRRRKVTNFFLFDEPFNRTFYRNEIIREGTAYF